MYKLAACITLIASLVACAGDDVLNVYTNHDATMQYKPVASSEFIYMGSRDGMLNHITLHHLQNFFHDHHDAGWLPDQGFFDQDELISFTQNLIKSCEKKFPSSSYQSVLTRHVSTNFSKYEDDDLLKPYRKCLSNTLLKTEFDATWIREYTKNTKYILFSEDLDLRAAIDKAKNDNVINFAEMLVVDRLASKKYESDSLTPVKTTNEQSDTDLLESF